MIYDILLDVGGTGIKGGYFSVEENKISDIYTFPSNAEREKEVIIKHFTALCHHIWNQIEDGEKTIRHVRMAFPGPFDYAKGISRVKGLAKYESLYGISIPYEMIRLGKKENYRFIPRDETDYKFINDVEAYALGAMNKRRLFQGSRVLYLCIGTGSGSAYSIDGRIAADASEGIPENGWIYPVPYKNSILDDYISVRGINKLAQRHCNKPFSPLELSQMAREGDIQAIEAYKEFGEDLKAGLLPLLKKFRANTCVIGGNISRSSGLFVSPVKDSCDELGIDLIIESETSELILCGLTKLP